MDSLTSTSKTSENVFLFIFILSPVSFGVCFYVCSLITNFKEKISTRANQKMIKNSSKDYVSKTWFKFWPMTKIFRKIWANKSLFMACLQDCQKWLSFATFRPVHSNLKEVSYILWQNKYSNLKTPCHIKPKSFLGIKLLENLLLAKYLISVAATLNLYKFIT